ncbi:alpha/beta fold hydrolase, partial [Dietzia sp. B44]|uniref:alpha/beta fold hydrolase n=1 Tax=Dietzia sp. B44 TaxID=1630633 RepID=UPI0015FD22CB
MLMIHGLGGIWWTMRAPVVALAEAGFHAVAADLRGHGDSDKPPRGYDGWTLAADITHLIRALGHTSAVIVGQGEGGFVAWT